MLRRKKWIALAACCLISGVVVSAPGANKERGRGTGGNPAVLLIDVGRAMKSSRDFVRRMEGLKTELERKKKEFSDLEADVRKTRQELAEQESGTPEYNLLERALAAKVAAGQAEAALVKKHFRSREAAIYYEHYQVMQREIEEARQLQSRGLKGTGTIFGQRFAHCASYKGRILSRPPTLQFPWKTRPISSNGGKPTSIGSASRSSLPCEAARSKT
jgi:Skp family chaperone for outer membrane proteins